MRDRSIADDEALAAQQLNERMRGVSQDSVSIRAQRVALQLSHIEDDAVLRLACIDHDSSCALKRAPTRHRNEDRATAHRPPARAPTATAPRAGGYTGGD